MNTAKKRDQKILGIFWSVLAIEAQPFLFRLKLKCACSLSCFPLKLPAGQKIRLLCMLQGKKDMSPIYVVHSWQIIISASLFLTMWCTVPLSDWLKKKKAQVHKNLTNYIVNSLLVFDEFFSTNCLTIF